MTRPRKTHREAHDDLERALTELARAILRHKPKWRFTNETPKTEKVRPILDELDQPCNVCGGRGWHTAGGNDPMACGACSAGEAWTA